MKVIIIGSGVAGSVLADLLSEQKHEVLVLEREKRPGGMCKSYYKQGFTYEYGPHILAMHNCSAKASKYIQSKISTYKTQLTTASSVGGKLTFYPPSIYSADRLGIGEQVRAELDQRPEEADESNFETYLVDKVGPTMYKLFFQNFTQKFWGVNPSQLSADWAKTRRLGEKIDTKRMFFNEKWCSYPETDWNELFSNLLKGKRVLYDMEVSSVDFTEKEIKFKNGGVESYDLLISTMHIDSLFNQRYGELPYTGYRIEPVVLDRHCYVKLDDDPVSMTYYPDSDVEYCRVSDYGTFQQKTHYPYSRRTIVTFEYPDSSIRLYPFSDARSTRLFEKYLADAAGQDSLITFGRMGLYKYLTTDTTVEMAFRLMEHIHNWQKMDVEARTEAYRYVRGEWNN